MSVGNMGPFGYLVNAPRVLKGNSIAFKLPSRQAREREEQSLTDISELPVFEDHKVVSGCKTCQPINQGTIKVLDNIDVRL
jgi:hypothetical protein